MIQTDVSDVQIINLKPGEEGSKSLESHLCEETLREHTKNARNLFKSITEELENREEDLTDGLSFLDLKNDTLLSYMIDVCNIVLRKVRGESIKGHPSVERCVEYRVILEKIKSIDQKLAYQLNKLISLPEGAEIDSHRLNVKNLDIDLDDIQTDGEGESHDSQSDPDESNLSNDGDDDDDEVDEPASDLSEAEDSDDARDTQKDVDNSAHMQRNLRNKGLAQRAKSKSVGVYKPPKLRSVAYDGDDNLDRSDKGRRKSYNDFYREEDGDEIIEQTRNVVDREREQFEEDNYTRLADNSTRKIKRKLKTKEYRRKNRGQHKKRRK